MPNIISYNTHKKMKFRNNCFYGIMKNNVKPTLRIRALGHDDAGKRQTD